VSTRSWFGSAGFLASPELSGPSPSVDMGGNEAGTGGGAGAAAAGGGGVDRWNIFGSRPIVQKSPTDPGSDTSPGKAS